VIDPVSVTRIVIAGEHPIFRHGLRRLIEAEPGFCIISEIGEGTGAVSLVRELAPDILLLGLTQANGTALAIIRELSADSASTRTIVLTNRVDSPDVMAAVQLGARGVVPKDSAPDLLFNSIRSVMAGNYWLGQEQLSAVETNLRKFEAARRQTKAFGLTRREIDIVRAVVSGYTNKEIAERSSITENTVKSHLTHIFDKLGASNRVELALFAAHHRLLDGV
jgi:two-component system nitrate/nitrite response regulator NarL